MRTNGKSPCFECVERKVGCHGRCERYIEYSKELKEYNETIRRNKELYYISYDKVRMATRM